MGHNKFNHWSLFILKKAIQEESTIWSSNIKNDILIIYYMPDIILGNMLASFVLENYLLRSKWIRDPKIALWKMLVDISYFGYTLIFFK